jgi:hypothetical protein
MPINIRLLLAVAAAIFALASLSHAGILFSGWEHRRAVTAEGVIAIVLAVAGVAAWSWPRPPVVCELMTRPKLASVALPKQDPLGVPYSDEQPARD